MYKTEMNFGIVVLLVLPGIATALVILCAAVPPSDAMSATRGVCRYRKLRAQTLNPKPETLKP